MASQEEIFSNKIEGLVQATLDDFRDEALSAQRGMFNRVLSSVKELDLRQGEIKTTTNNIRKLKSIRNDLEEIIINDSWRSRVQDYVNKFPDVKEITDEYFQTLGVAIKPNQEAYRIILQQEIESAKNALLQTGINNRVIQPIDDLLKRNIQSGGNFEDLVDSLRVTIKGSANNLGNLEQYAQQITNDSLNQYNRTYQQTITQDLGMVWYYYAGAIKNTSRDYCVRRVREDRYFHQEEVKDTASESWSGKIPGTTASTIFTYCGGYNCGHRYVPTLKDRVPKRVIERAKRAGIEV